MTTIKMKKYIGKKQIQAESMTKGDAFMQNLLRSDNTPTTEEEKQEPGYKVVYEDGYVSWSPAETFEKAYRCIDTYIDRLLIEKDELHEKLEKLDTFTTTEAYANLEYKDRHLLDVQYIVMRQYEEILTERIERTKQ